MLIASYDEFWIFDRAAWLDNRCASLFRDCLYIIHLWQESIGSHDAPVEVVSVPMGLLDAGLDGADAILLAGSDCQRYSVFPEDYCIRTDLTGGPPRM